MVNHGHRIERLHSVNERGRSVLDLSYADFRPELFGVGLHRDVLFRELHIAALAEPNIKIVYGFDVDRLEIAGAEHQKNRLCGRDATATDSGVSATAAGPFDLLVVADGRTSIRTSTSARAIEKW